MRVLYHSAPPTADTGYGVHTRNLVQRLRDSHDINIQSVGGWEGMGIDWRGIKVYPSGAGKFGEQSIPYWFEKTDSDVVFSHHDHWSFANIMSGIQEGGIPTVLYTILDHELPGKRPPESVVVANENTLRTVVMSEWAEERMRNSRVPQEKVVQIPHAVDTSKYGPVTDEIPDKELKRDLGIPEDSFLFGMVAANYGPRKNIPLHIDAFKEFIDRNNADDAYFYIHTHPTMGGGYNLYEVRDGLNIDDERVIFPDPHEMYHGIEDLIVVQLYNTFDVHLNCTQSESWGLTITEAMSTGTPVIATNFSAMTEQFGVPYDTHVSEEEGYRVTDNGILIHRGSEIWTQNATARRFTPGRENIISAMEYYYYNQDKIKEHGENARDWVKMNYDWDIVYEDHWEPLFDDIEEEISGDYNEYYFKRRDIQTQSEAFKNEVLNIVMEVRGDTILDIGCGTGTLIESLKNKGYNVTGVDKYKEAVEMAKEKDVEAYQMEAENLEFKDNSFDTVVSQHVLEHIEPDIHVMSEMVRVASEKVVVITPVHTTVSEELDPTEVRRYNIDDIEKLKEDFEDVTGYEMEYKKERVSENNENWMITVDVNE